MSTAQLQLEQLRSLEPRQLRLIGAAALLLLLAALLMYLVLPQWRAYQGLRTSVDLLSNSVAQGGSLETQLAALRAEVETLEHTLNGDASNLPTRQMQAFVIGRLQTISWRNNMTLVSVQPREGDPVSQFRELIFDVQLRGSYFGLYRWLQNIDEELGFVVIKHFEISRAGPAEAGEPELQIRLTMAAYRNES